MTSPLAGEGGAEFAAALEAPSRRRRANEAPSTSLALSRVVRGIRRQAAPFVLSTSAITALGAAFEMASDAPLLEAALAWAPIGAGVALGAVLLREIGRNTVTSLRRLERYRGYSVLGAAPELTQRALRQLPPDARTPAGCLSYAPSSPFAAAFRQLQDAIAADHVVAFIAPGVNEGASTAALCAGIAAKQQGRRVIVVDCDIRRRSLTRMLGEDAESGVLEAAENPEAWRTLLREEPETGLHYLPAAAPDSPWRSLFAAPGFDALLNALRAEYDLVVLDCPPALGNAEGAMIARLAHRCVVVAAWDETPLGVLRATMRALRTRSRATTGLYVNRVPAGYRSEQAQAA